MIKKMSNEDYRKAKGIANSDLKYLEISPLHYEAYKKGLFSYENDNFTIGDLVHSMVLEPQRTQKEYCKEEFEGCELNKNTKAYKEAKAKFLEENKNKIIIPKKDWEEAEKMARNVKAIAGNLFQGGEPELSIFTTDRHGIVRKCRPDYYNKKLGLVIDLKTTSAKSDDEFQKALWNFKYHWQQYWYMETLRLAGLPINKFIFVVVSKAPEHLVWVVELADEWIEIAEVEVEELINSYVRFLQTGEADVVKKIKLPYWVKK